MTPAHRAVIELDYLPRTAVDVSFQPPILPAHDCPTCNAPSCPKCGRPWDIVARMCRACKLTEEAVGEGVDCLLAPARIDRNQETPMTNDDCDTRDSGPYCNHWNEAFDCDVKCAACRHKCREHANYARRLDNTVCEADDCSCKNFTDGDTP